MLDSPQNKCDKCLGYPEHIELTTWAKKELELDNNLKRLMKNLGAAINDALSDSEEISEAIQDVRDSGYDVFLVLEATIGFNRRSEDKSSDENETPIIRSEIKFKVNSQDMKFLKSLKIKVDDLDQQ